MDTYRNELFKKILFYAQEILRQSPIAISYLLHVRKLNPWEITHYRLGYLPGSDAFVNFLHTTEYPREFLEKIRLLSVIKEDNYEHEFSDFGDHRIVMPEFYGDAIYNLQVREINSFLFPDRMSYAPKYLSTYFDASTRKSIPWYNIEGARKEMIDRNFAILVEGKFDAIGVARKNQNVVPFNGTSCYMEQLGHLKQYTNRIIAANDNDKAGWRAYEQLCSQASYLGMEVRRFNLHPFKDPDEMMRTAPWLWKERLEEVLY